MKASLLSAAVPLLSAFAASSPQALTVAEGANTAGSIPVRFASGQNRIAGNLYVPASCTAAAPCPAVAVTHPWGGVKEQTAGLYAQLLFKKGFVTLAYDASHYGESTGEPKDFENPADRVADIRNAVSFLANRPEVAGNRIATLGICAGGGYTLHEAQGDPRVKAVAAVAAYDIGGAAREGISGSPVTESARRVLLEAAAAEWTKTQAGAEPVTGDLLPDRSKWTASTDAFTKEAFSYYRETRGASPNARNRYHLASLGLHLSYWPLDHMEAISPRPVLLVAGEKAETLKFSEEAYRRAGEPKELVVIPAATHFELYDRYAEQIAERLAAFYRDALK